MPPQVKNGAVLNVRRQILPPTQLFCDCYECIVTFSIDPRSKNPVRGRYISHPEHKRHRAAENRRGIASARAAEAFVDSTPPILNLPTPPSLFSFQTVLHPNTQPTSRVPDHPPTQENAMPAKATPSRRKPQSRTRSGEIQVDFVFSKLKGIQSTFRITRAPDMADNLVQNPLVFLTPPIHSSTPLEHLQIRNREHWCRLDDAASANSVLIGHEEWLLSARRFIEEHIKSDSPKSRVLAKSLLKHTISEQENVKQVIYQEWERQRLEAFTAGPHAVNTGDFVQNVCSHHIADMVADRYMQRSYADFEPILFFSYLLVAVLHLFCGVSMDQCSYVLAHLRILLHLALSSSSNPRTKSIISTFPGDIRYILNILDLEPPATALVCCPSCFYTYPIDPDDPDPYPEHCTNQETPTSDACGRRLQKTMKKGNSQFTVAAREFLYQDIRQWLAKMYSRAKVEEIFDRDHPHPDNDDMGDIWDAPVLHELLGPDGKPFIEAPGNESRLVFSLNEDGFNPYGNKISGKQVSVGGLYMICMNLPPALRYKVENMFLVGVIPGPQEPSLNQINYILRPLVTDLLVLWTDGVYLRRTT